MDCKHLQTLLLNPSALELQDLEQLEDLLLDYPYAQTLRLLYLCGLCKFDSARFQPELQKAALYIADRKTLYYFLDLQKTYHNQSLKAVQTLQSEVSESTSGSEKDKTLTLIDSFLSQVPEEEKEVGEIELATDYTGYLLEEEVQSSEPMDRQGLIDEFLNNPEEKKSISPAVAPAAPMPEEKTLRDPMNSELTENEDEGFFTETLAKIYVRQGRYAKALEILKKLSLKYPNKNAYFADQIRFLEKLIINEKSK